MIIIWPVTCPRVTFDFFFNMTAERMLESLANCLLELLENNMFIFDELYASESYFICDKCFNSVLTVLSISTQILRNTITRNKKLRKGNCSELISNNTSRVLV